RAGVLRCHVQVDRYCHRDLVRGARDRWHHRADRDLATNEEASMNRRSTIVGLGAALVSPSAWAKEWPEKEITWVVPFPAGGPTDTFTRPLAEDVGKRLGQTIAIDNRSGAGGTIGAAVVARAPADGYTMLVGYTGFTYAPLIYANAGFDLLRDFVPIS